ncbi:MAG: U32 family peptidase [Anaerolineaceae bacterium]|nr:U32 family peptidase [Anaerolineaceae bacterium]
MDRIELLSPAKDLETGKAAINCGADAVYIGATAFGARESAGNSLNAVRELIDYAHKYWARVYVTVNTLLRDDELEAAGRLIHELYDSGVDAIIIQDTGLLELDLPPVPLFASTQMHNHSPERVAFLEKVGIRRAILARELSLTEIRAIRQATTLELETFVHGALCVSYSGQCYMSYALGGRSGNRGQCAQPCRRPYNLEDGNGKLLQKGKHLLSLRDLNLSDDLGALLDAGVCSFKIEGRLKDKAYVMNVVGHYRRKLDALLEGKKLRPASSGKVYFDFTPNPAKTFNRGFTQYFLHGRKQPVGSPDTPKSLGEPVGRVAKIERYSFSLDSKVEIHRGDGLCYFNADRELTGTTVNDVQGGRIFPSKGEGLALGTEVFRNHDHEFLSALEKSQTERKMAVRLRLAETMKGYALFALDEDGNEVMLSMETEKLPAEKPEQAEVAIDKQLRKLGGTEFECTFLRSDLSQPYFIPLGTLNALRRGAVEALLEERGRNFPRLSGEILRNDAPFPEQKLSYRGNVLNEKARAFYQRHGVMEIEPAAESGLEMRGRLVMTTKHCIKHQLGACKRFGGTQVVQEPLTLVDEDGNRYGLKFDCARCVMEVYFGETEDFSANLRE